MSQPKFRLNLDAVGYGLVIPVFFVSNGLRFDLDSLRANPSALARVPLYLLALLAVRAREDPDRPFAVPQTLNVHHDFFVAENLRLWRPCISGYSRVPVRACAPEVARRNGRMDRPARNRMSEAFWVGNANEGRRSTPRRFTTHHSVRALVVQ